MVNASGQIVTDLQSVMFDLDGVLVDACEWHYESLNQALMCNGYHQISRQDHVSTFNGLPTSTKLRILKIPMEDQKKIWDSKQKFTIEVIHKLAEVDYLKIEMLQWLRESRIKVACVTNSITETATLMLEKTGQLPYIDFLVTNEMVNHPKPAPDGYLMAMDYFFSDASRSIAVEDSPKGIVAAKESKAVVWEVRKSSDVTLESLKEFMANHGFLVGDKQ